MVLTKEEEKIINTLAEVSWFQYCYEIDFEEAMSMWKSKRG